MHTWGGRSYHNQITLNRLTNRESLAMAAAILASIRRHRVIVSMGAEVGFRASVNGRPYDIGADVGQGEGVIDFTAEVTTCPAPAQARIVKNGRVVAEAAVVGGRAGFGFQDDLRPDQSAWYRLDVYDSAGLMLAITNPIFAGPPCEPTLHTFGDFVG